MPASLTVTELTAGNGPFVGGTFFDLATVGYQQAEYAVSGTVRAFQPAGDGLAVVDEAPITTRMLVYRPIDAAAFDGTVLVEWLNVSGGVDAAPRWTFTHRERIRSGAAWVGLSAQAVGIHGGASAIGVAQNMALQEVDAARYGSLSHPGDRFSYDLLSQVGRLVRTGEGTILGDLPVERALAAGESQSAFRLVTYVNHVDRDAVAFDGFLVHARGGSAAPFEDYDDPTRILGGDPAPFRDDLRVPVLCVQAETDLITLGYQAARQADGDQLVIWEMAGTSHADVYTFRAGFVDDGLQPIEAVAEQWRPMQDLFGTTLERPVNAGPQHWIMNSAVRALAAWVRDGARPPAADRLQVVGTGFATDEAGNALGGIRTPHVDVPTAVLSGLGNSGGPIAFLSGCTTPFDRAQLAERYGTKETFVERFRASAEATAAAGFFCPEDLEEIVGIAAHNVDL
jgi:hypothetical protein